MSQYLLAIDQGTTSSRAIIFDTDGTPVGTDQQEFPQYFPADGWVEHDADEIWESVMHVVLAAIESADISVSDIRVAGITNQRETTVLWDRGTGAPIGKAIVWQDRRTAEYCQSLKDDGFENVFRAKTGLLLDPYFSATKVRWMLDHIDGAHDVQYGLPYFVRIVLHPAICREVLRELLLIRTDRRPIGVKNDRS